MLKKNHLAVNLTAGLALYGGMQLLKINEQLPLHDIAVKTNALFFPGTHSQYVDLAIYMFIFVIAGILPDFDRQLPLLKHRGFSHSIWVPFFSFVIGYVFKIPQIIVFSLGYFWHILIDALSVRGIDWFYPIGSGTIKYSGGARITNGHFFSLYKTGRFSEYIVLVVISVINIFIIFLWFDAILQGRIQL